MMIPLLILLKTNTTNKNIDPNDYIATGHPRNNRTQQRTKIRVLLAWGLAAIALSSSLRLAEIIKLLSSSRLIVHLAFR